MTRVLLAALAYVVSLAGVAVVAFVIVMFAAGPHAGLLPGWLEAVVLGLGWLAVLMLPALAARAVWQRGRKPAESHDAAWDDDARRVPRWFL